MFGSNQRIRGIVTLTVQDAITGKVKQVQRHNLVTNNGEQWIARRVLAITGQSPTAMRYIEVGKGSRAATASDTTLQTTIANASVSNVRKRYTTLNVSGATWNIIVNYGTSDANTSSIKEAGIFGVSTRSGVNGNGVPGMLARTVFSAVNKTNSDTLKIQWQINFADDGV